MKFVSLLTVLITLALVPTAAFAETTNSAPRLILQITVDQLRGDLPGRYADRYGEGGFRYLLEKGTHYSNALYQHSNLETIVGHVVLATGAFPSAHGMVANVWLDRETGELGYAIEDNQYDLVGTSGGVDKKTEIDPTQAAAKGDGRSPELSSLLHSATSWLWPLPGARKSSVYRSKTEAPFPWPDTPAKPFGFPKKQGSLSAAHTTMSNIRTG